MLLPITVQLVITGLFRALMICGLPRRVAGRMSYKIGYRKFRRGHAGATFMECSCGLVAECGMRSTEIPAMSARHEMSENSTSPLLYRAIFEARVKAAVAMATAVKNAPPPASTVHTGVQGQIREILVRELFRPLLPPDIGVGTGQLIDRCNNLSPETDIILFDRRLAPPMMLNESLGFFPIESCLFVVEVKTTLDSEKLRNSHRDALRIRKIEVNNLNTLRERYHQIGHKIEEYKHLRYGLFSFSSDATGPECLRYQKYYSALPPEEQGVPFGPP
jgi:hypothetical protein